MTPANHFRAVTEAADAAKRAIERPVDGAFQIKDPAREPPDDVPPTFREARRDLEDSVTKLLAAADGVRP